MNSTCQWPAPATNSSLDLAPISPNFRRNQVGKLVAAMVLTAALASPLKGIMPKAQTVPLPPPPAMAYYRPDGGQILSPQGPIQPNGLTRLNLGLQIDPTLVPEELLTALPGLGQKSSAKAAASGCLTANQKKALTGLVIEKCAQINP